VSVAAGRPGPGAHGFSEGGEFDFTVGSLRGLRVWNLESGGVLRGSFGADWADGENVAYCPNDQTRDGPVAVLATAKAFAQWCRHQRISPEDPRIRLVSGPGQAAALPAGSRWIELRDGFLPLPDAARLRQVLASGHERADCHAVRMWLRHPHQVPGPNGECGCGFWAYWTPEQAGSVYRPARPVLGVIEAYGRTRIGEKGFRAEKARIIAVCRLFDFADPDLDTAAEMQVEKAYPSVNVYATPECMLALHPPTKDYLPAPAEPRTVADVRVPRLACPAGIPLGRIEQQVNVPAVPGLHTAMVQSELKAWHADKSECEHLADFLASGGQAVITRGGVQGISIRYARGGWTACGGGGGSYSVTVGGGGGGSSAGGTYPVTARGGGGGSSSAGWQPVWPSTGGRFSAALGWGLGHHPSGVPRATGGSGTVRNLP
jgi:hypothetical protein